MFKIIDFEKFVLNCQQGKCLRRTLTSKQCQKESKQIKCYNKYKEQKEKEYKKQFEDVDFLWLELKDEIKLRDESCMLEKILTVEEIQIVEKQDDYWLNNKFLDCSHIVPRQSCPNQIYNADNIILLGRMFHSRLDNYCDPVTGIFIGMEGMADWWTRIMQQNERWSGNYDYWHFRKDMMEKED